MLLFYDEIRNINGLTYEKPLKFLVMNGKDKVVSYETKGGVSGVYPFIIMPAIMNTKENFWAYC